MQLLVTQPWAGAALKALLYLGAGLLLGAGLMKFRVFRALPGRVIRHLIAAAALGAGLVILPSLALLFQTPILVLGRADAEFMLEYALNSKEGG